jgi:hypothetical protein
VQDGQVNDPAGNSSITRTATFALDTSASSLLGVNCHSVTSPPHPTLLALSFHRGMRAERRA